MRLFTDIIIFIQGKLCSKNSCSHDSTGYPIWPIQLPSPLNPARYKTWCKQFMAARWGIGVWTEDELWAGYVFTKFRFPLSSTVPFLCCSLRLQPEYEQFRSDLENTIHASNPSPTSSVLVQPAPPPVQCTSPMILGATRAYCGRERERGGGRSRYNNSPCRGPSSGRGRRCAQDLVARSD